MSRAADRRRVGRAQTRPAGRPTNDDLGWATVQLARTIGAYSTEEHLEMVTGVNAWLATGPPERILDRAMVLLARAQAPDAQLFDLPAPIATRIAKASVELADVWATGDPRLGQGRDTRAAYALALGLTTGAGIMYHVISDPSH